VSWLGRVALDSIEYAELTFFIVGYEQAGRFATRVHEEQVDWQSEARVDEVLRKYGWLEAATVGSRV
jgi:hypothetical protein